ncbi:MAG TPA: tetratricopeptide repeat protein, partial [Anaerolineaceae bacterium]|nr:tetratricopeptide repeat protein [Anaerolineaceae bacterium]
PLEQQANLHLLVGRLARQQGQLDQAVHHLSEAISLYPTVEAYLELGRAEADRRRPDRALQAYERAMQLDPTDARPYYRAGLLYRDIHDYPQAERYLRRAVQLAPKNLAIRRALAAVASINLIHPIKSTTNEG